MSSAIRRSLEKRVEKACTPQQRHLANEDLASHLTEKKDFEGALFYYQQTLIEAEKLKDQLKIAKAYRMIGEVKTELAQYDEAITHLKKYLEMTSSPEDEFSSGDDFLVEQQRAYTSLGRIYLHLGEANLENQEEDSKNYLKLSIRYTSLSLKHVEKLEKKHLCKKEQVNLMRAISLLNLGLAQELNLNIDEAIDTLKVAVVIARSFDEGTLTCRCLAALSNLYVKKNKPTEISEYTKEGLQLCKKLPPEERASQTSSFLILQADGYLLDSRFRSARRKLHEAYKILLKNPDDEFRATAEKRLRTVVGMQKLQAQLDNLTEDSYAERAKCYELLGDAFSALSLYKIALFYYEDQLKCLQSGNLDLRLCYASLGQTARDCGFYEKAIDYFEREVELCSSAEAHDSYLSIGQCQTSAGFPPEVYIESFKSAYRKAVECGNQRKQEVALKVLEEHQRPFDPDAADKTRLLREQIAYNYSQSDSEDDKNTPDIGDDIDLELLSDCESSGDEDGPVQQRTPVEERQSSRPKRNPRRQNALWRNEKGETKLHIACMQGNLKNAKIFLREGCDINVLDYAGWTPLHEACNHGHLDTVRFLLEKGADVNHEGGKEVGGLTPLHDAASAGNFEVIHVLLDHNASVTKLTDSGETVLDMLEDYYQKNVKTEGFSDLEFQNYQHVKDRLVGLMDKVGFKKEFNTKAPVKSNQMRQENSGADLRNRYHNKRIGDLRTTGNNLDNTFTRKRSMRALSPIHRRSPSSSPRSSSPESDRESRYAEMEERKLWTDEYRKVMTDLRHRNTGNQVSRPPSPKPAKPLLSADEVVDEWLEDDLGINSKPQKKRKAASEVYECFGPRSRESSRRQSRQKLSLSETGSPSESARRSTEEASKSMWPTSPVDFGNDENRDLNASIMHSEDVDMKSRSPSPRRLSSGSKPTKLNVRRSYQSSLLSAGFERYSPPLVSSTQLSQQLAPQPFAESPQAPAATHVVAVHRVNVKIEEQLLAVPVASLDLTIGWLADEASSRYYKIEGVRPTLRLKTRDGALLSHDDPVSLLIGGGDVIGDVTNFNLPPIATRYQDACAALNVEHDHMIAASLEACQATHELRIAQAALSTAVLRPVIRAVAMENFLQRLDLSQNSLRDEGVLELCEHSTRLTRLQELDLSGNMITSQGLSYLSDAVEAGKFKSLTSVSLNYNDLQDRAVSHLAKLTAALPQLIALHLAGCGFTRAIWEQCGSSLQLSNIEILDLSCNALQARGLSGFLGNNQPASDKRLNPDKLRTLLLVGVEGALFCRELRQFLERGQNPALVELHITAPRMTDENLADLLSGLQNATKFATLRLLSASSLTARGLYSLLDRHPPISKLEVQGGENLVFEVHDVNFEQAMYDAVKRAAWQMQALTIKSPYNKTEHNLSSKLETAWREACGYNCGVKRSSRDLLKLTKHRV